MLGMEQSSDYRKAYDSAKQELTDLLAKQKEIEKRIVKIRQSLQTLATLCEAESVEIEPSEEAAYLLEHSTLADEIRIVLIAMWPNYARPNIVRAMLVRMGRDLTKYTNPLATVHMVLKRMVESGDAQEATTDGPDGKKAYRLIDSLSPDEWARIRARLERKDRRKGELIIQNPAPSGD